MHITDFPITSRVWAGLLYRNEPALNASFIDKYHALNPSSLSAVEKESLMINLQYADTSVRKSVKSHVQKVSKVNSPDRNSIDIDEFSKHLHTILQLESKYFYVVWNELSELPDGRSSVVDFYIGYQDALEEHPLKDMLATSNYQDYIRPYYAYIKQHHPGYAVRLGLFSKKELMNTRYEAWFSMVNRYDVGFSNTLKCRLQQKQKLSTELAVDALCHMKKLSELSKMLPYLLHDESADKVIYTLFGSTLFCKKDITYENMEILAEVFRQYPDLVYQHTGRLNRDLLMVLELYTHKVHKKALNYFSNHHWQNINQDKFTTLKIKWDVIQNADYLFGVKVLEHYSDVEWPHNEDGINLPECELLW